MSRLRRSVQHGIGRLTASTGNSSSSNSAAVTATTTTTTAETTTTSSSNSNERKTTTRLIEIGHKAPCRLIPLTGKSSIKQAGAAICAISHYGGGMVQGDSLDISIKVEHDAKLAITSQGANRIYSQKKKKQNNNIQQQQQQEQQQEQNNTNNNTNTKCTIKFNATIEKNGLFVLAPDYCSLFKQSSFEQKQIIQLHKSSSIVIIDWFSSGRYRNGEQWDFNTFKSTNTYMWLNDDENDNDNNDNDNNANNNNVFLHDSITMDQRILPTTTTISNNNNNNDPFGVANINAFASLMLYGKQIQSVIQVCEQLQDTLLQTYTNIRNRPTTTTTTSHNNNNNNVNEKIKTIDTSIQLLQRLGGRISLGISRIPLKKNNNTYNDEDDDDNEEEDLQGEEAAYMIRLAATTNEDIYRILHHCLFPLASSFGLQLYKDRIQSSSSSSLQETTTKKGPDKTNNNNRLSSKQQNSVTTKDSFTLSPLSSLSEKRTGGLFTTGEEDPTGRMNNSSSLPSSSLEWATYMLTDSCLPIGSFAHSSGLEVATQIGLLQPNNENDISNFIQTATRSTMQQIIPFIITSHRLFIQQQQQQQQQQIIMMDDDGDEDMMIDTFITEWTKLDQQAQVMLASNTPACAASLDQGKSLARVTYEWLQMNNNNNNNNNIENDEERKNNNLIKLKLKLLQQLQQRGGHLGPMMGIVSAMVGLTDERHVCHLMGYCIGRDMVSAAVRLSLIGPLASVRILHQVQNGAQDGIHSSYLAIDEAFSIAAATTTEKEQQDYDVSSNNNTNVTTATNNIILSTAATSAPVLETIHPCHDLLQVRLFRS